MAGHAKLIERFSDDTALYADSDGGVWLVSKQQNQPVVYCVCNGRSMIKACPRIERWDASGNSTLVAVGGRDIYDYLDAKTDLREGEVDLIKELYPWIVDAYWKQITELSSLDNKLAVCNFFQRYRPLIEKGYPYQYLVILCFSKSLLTIMEAIQANGWEIHPQHLCQALDVTHLTQGQRKFIRSIRLNSPASLEGLSNNLKGVIENWEQIGHKFHHVNEIDEMTVLIMTDAMKSCPALIDAHWYLPSIFEPDDYMACLVEESLLEAWQYVCATKGDIDADDFAISYVKNMTHLYRLKGEAESYFEAQALTHALAAYPDDYVFPEPDFQHENSGFIHVRTAGELRRYSMELKNCAASYVPYAAKGKYLLFYYEHEIRDTGVVERGMLQICTRSLNQLLNSEEPPVWDRFRTNRIVRQFKGTLNLDMSDGAWGLLESFVCIYILGEWKRRRI